MGGLEKNFQRGKANIAQKKVKKKFFQLDFVEIFTVVPMRLFSEDFLS